MGSNDAGWVIPKSLFRRESICYCVGCGEDISFDLSLIKTFGCAVYGFDPTPRAIAFVGNAARDAPLYHFSDIGLWDREDVLKFFAPRNEQHVSHSLVNLQRTEHYIEVKVRRLADIMRNNCHQRLDLLKLDVEGAEYKVIDSLLEDHLDIRIICVEFDEFWNPLDADYLSRIKEYVAKLIDAGYALVSCRGNGNYTF